jgi:hypothetical protein
VDHGVDVRLGGSLIFRVPNFSVLQWFLVLCGGGCVAGWLSAWMRLADLLSPEKPKWMAYMQPWMWRVENYTDETEARRRMWTYRGWVVGLVATMVALATTL